MIWTATLVKRLTKLWLDGYSSPEIATRLGITRNAVMGKVHRLKLGPHSSSGVVALKKAKRRGSFKAHKGIVSATSSLKDGFCRYPIGPLESPDFMYCMEISGKDIYCQKHMTLCRIPSKYQRVASS